MKEWMNEFFSEKIEFKRLFISHLAVFISFILAAAICGYFSYHLLVS
jgi:hypothetical protein